jgi:hypothetical protein
MRLSHGLKWITKRGEGKMKRTLLMSAATVIGLALAPILFT